MPTDLYVRPNSLGDLRAEADITMLNQVFVETADYRTLIETSDRTIVVGRRGTGKSALVMRLNRYWESQPGAHIINVAPDEYETMSLRPLAGLFGTKFRWIRAGMRIAWWYAFMMEVAACLLPRYSFAKDEKYAPLRRRAREWQAAGNNILLRSKTILQKNINHEMDESGRIGDLAIRLDVNNLLDHLSEACERLNVTIIFLIDRLDEGYEPDDIGTGLIDGLIQGAIEIKTRITKVHPNIFLRDNIFRSIQELDPDYSRNIEGNVLRLHWDEETLLDFATRRMRLVFEVPHEAKERIWNQCATEELRGRNGFRKLLRLTLYRPRDLLSLLNDTFYLARSQQLSQISIQQVDQTATAISENRLGDLRKEYEAIVPSLSTFIEVFEGHPPEWSITAVTDSLQDALSSNPSSSIVRQDLAIWNNSSPVVDVLFSIGFLGIRDPVTGRFIFCHDGRTSQEIERIERVLVHPCYWKALHCGGDSLGTTEAEEIYDEYEIHVSSETPRIRSRRIDELIEELETIPKGHAGARAYEDWCLRAIRTCFPKGLRNIELRPNGNARERRDIVGTNFEEGKAWERIYKDYQARQVVFEIKNYKELKADDYRQICSYLGGDYGRLAFVVTRDERIELFKGRDVEWVRDIFYQNECLIVKLTGLYLCGLVDKLKNPQRHDRVNDALSKLLDTYARRYMSGQSSGTVSAKEKRRNRRREQRNRRKKNTARLANEAR